MGFISIAWIDRFLSSLSFWNKINASFETKNSNSMESFGFSFFSNLIQDFNEQRNKKKSFREKNQLKNKKKNQEKNSQYSKMNQRMRERKRKKKFTPGFFLSFFDYFIAVQASRIDKTIYRVISVQKRREREWEKFNQIEIFFSPFLSPHKYKLLLEEILFEK